MVRIASATGVPCATRTSTWRSFATISSGLCLFLDMGPSSFGSHEPYLRADHFMGGRITIPSSKECRMTASTLRLAFSVATLAGAFMAFMVVKNPWVAAGAVTAVVIFGTIIGQVI